ncbi:hypothetical protein Rleg4DRAFT_2293 [Rhizobium leguminosarum bv. trifolii WSM2297]|uniref:Uncharacterized protein n=1 Tax=Rhizobium leguminosarum bv. trifolii WSM2297 TaxID=754762 RepID=J0W641_RHILT|nr:hypothetical protein [Rhizobium leguminosarum]EJC80658.1 hypothetical protein Rleg4DRAFT_2293 [Rhizobium leguminosarum bv. trifolii WSM2297]
MAQYPFNVDVSTLEGQIEILRLWSIAELVESTARSILRVTTSEFLELAQQHGINPPTQEALDKRVWQLESLFRPQLRDAKRKQIGKGLTQARMSVNETLDTVAALAIEAEAYGQGEAQRLYAVVHARLRRSLDSIASAQETFGKARSLEDTYDDGFEYNEENLKVLRGLNRVVRRPDYYLIGDFNHIDPVTEQDILWCWSQGFLATSTALEMLALEEGDRIDEIAIQLGIPLPTEEAMLPAEAAAILGDEPVDGDPAFEVRRRIRDGRLASYFRFHVEARRDFEEVVRRRSRQNSA